MKQLVTLGIESSCDETSAAVVVDGREILSNVISSQLDSIPSVTNCFISNSPSV